MSLSEGRFISEDPLWGNIFDPQSLNRFAYGRNNPYRFKDPSGRFFESFLTTVHMIDDEYGINIWHSGGFRGVDLAIQNTPKETYAKAKSAASNATKAVAARIESNSESNFGNGLSGQEIDNITQSFSPPDPDGVFMDMLTYFGLLAGSPVELEIVNTVDPIEEYGYIGQRKKEIEDKYKLILGDALGIEIVIDDDPNLTPGGEIDEYWMNP